MTPLRLPTALRLLRRGIGVAGMIAVGWVIVQLYQFMAPVSPATFDPAAWRDPIDHYDRNNPRSRMVDDVMGRLTVGMSPAAVTDLLGPPDIPGDDCAYYHIGWRSQMMDPDSLAVCYADGGVSTVRIHHH
jgi:hypothetical protein